MFDRLSATEFHERSELPDWRILLDRIEAEFAAPSFADAAEFVGRIAVAAEAAEHHPDVHLRYPGRVHITLTTHAAAGLTDADAELAEQISVLATEAELSSEPMSAFTVEIGIDALDIAVVRPFWKAVLGYEDAQPQRSGDLSTVLVDPRRIGPPVWFQQMDAPRRQRNRIHLDVTVPDDAADARLTAALAAGGTLLDDTHARAFWVLADPEGNEACICTWEET